MNRGARVDPTRTYAGCWAPRTASSAKLIDHKEFIARYGDDMPEITGWKWGQEAASAGVRSTEADNV